MLEWLSKECVFGGGVSTNTARGYNESMITGKSQTLLACLGLSWATALNLTMMAFACKPLDSVFQTSNQSNRTGIYNSIPEPLRQSFRERMTLFLRHRYSKNWTELYDLLLASSIRNRTKEQFVEDYRKYPGVAGTGRNLVSFSPTIIQSSDTYWTIYGCAKLKGVKFKVDAFIIASREAGEWRFSDLDMLTPRDTPFKKCSQPKR